MDLLDDRLPPYFLDLMWSAIDQIAKARGGR
jgi:hypothetical protein